MNLVHWRPFREFEAISCAGDRLQLFVEPTGCRWWTFAKPRWITDRCGTARGSGEDLSVSLADGVLSVRGERKREPEPSEARVHRAERRVGRFERNFRLPEDADAGAIVANNRNGILYLRIPKQAASSPRNIEIKVS